MNVCVCVCVCVCVRVYACPCVCVYLPPHQALLDSNGGDMLFLVQKAWLTLRGKEEWAATEAERLAKKVRRSFVSPFPCVCVNARACVGFDSSVCARASPALEDDAVYPLCDLPPCCVCMCVCVLANAPPRGMVLF